MAVPRRDCCISRAIVIWCFADVTLLDSFMYKSMAHPSEYDVVLSTNTWGNIISNGMSPMVGGLGMVHGINLGDDHVMAEPIHGTPAHLEGKDIANPLAAMRCVQAAWVAWNVLTSVQSRPECVIKAIPIPGNTSYCPLYRDTLGCFQQGESSGASIRTVYLAAGLCLNCLASVLLVVIIVDSPHAPMDWTPQQQQLPLAILVTYGTQCGGAEGRMVVGEAPLPGQ